MYILGATIAGAITVVLATLHILRNIDTTYFDIPFAIFISVICILVAAGLSWVTIGIYSVVGITYIIYNKVNKSKEDK